MLIPPEVFPISRVCDTESARYALGAVRLERTPEGPVAVATDGRTVIACQWREGDRDSYPEGLDTQPVEGFVAMIHQKNWNEAAKLPLKKSSKPVLRNLVVEEATATEQKITLGATDLETERTIGIRPVEGKYPNWRNTIPDRPPYLEIVVSFDSQRLGELMAVLKPLTEEERFNAVAIHVPLDTTQPVVFKATAKNIDTTAVVMPLSAHEQELQERAEHRNETIEAINTAMGFSIPTQFPVWVYEICTNEQLDYLRDRADKQAVLDDEADEAERAERAKEERVA